jgi:hypothetical protein
MSFFDRTSEQTPTQARSGSTISDAELSDFTLDLSSDDEMKEN